jgi:two-component system, LytTR family, sensor kinase
MNSRLTRALLVVAVFALLAILSAAGSYVVGEARSPMPAPMAKPFGLLWWANFRYFLAWALVTPLVLRLGRLVPLARGTLAKSVVFHVAVPVVGSLPFFGLRLLLNSVLSWHVPSLGALMPLLRKVLLLETLSVLPIYWMLLSAGWAFRFYREYEAERFHAIELQRSLAAAELDALQMKLQPHFLFNTLNAIGTLAREGDTSAISHIVEHLGVLLRLSMETGGRQFVTLDEELALLDEYLAIEEVRFGDQLRVVRHLDARARRALVPNMILQPLVENALVHGLAGRIGAGLVEVSSAIDGTMLTVSVRDDGPGLAPGWTLSRHAGRGLTNVAERMSALFGGDGELEVVNAPGGGTSAALRLPLSFVEGGQAMEHP